MAFPFSNRSGELREAMLRAIRAGSLLGLGGLGCAGTHTAGAPQAGSSEQGGSSALAGSLGGSGAGANAVAGSTTSSAGTPSAGAPAAGTQATTAGARGGCEFGAPERQCLSREEMESSVRLACGQIPLDPEPTPQ